jgi:bifunctional non-homologous end joining protein LigD
MPASIPPMRAVAGELPTDGGWAYEVKWDGVRAIGFLGDGRLRLQSSNVLDITARYPELDALATELHGHEVVLDGEIVTFNEDGRPDFGLLQNRMHLTGGAAIAEWSARQPVVWVLFDLLHFDGHDLYVPPPAPHGGGGSARAPAPSALVYADRRRLLEGLVDAGPNWQVPTARVADGAGLLTAVHQRGLEGVVAKRLDSRYEAGRRSPAWRKVKVRLSQEFVVGGWRAGEGNRAGGIGSLLVGYHTPDGRLAYAGRVGSGLSGPEITILQRLFADGRRDTCPFAPPPTRDEQRDATWVEPRLVVQVAFGEWSRDDRLRHPAYLGRRADKDPAEVVRE